MKLSELNALSSMLGGDTEDVEVAPGVVLTMRPCGVRRYVRNVVRLHRSIREQFLAPARMIKSASRSGATDADAMSALDWEAQAEASLGDRIEADTALVACCMADAESEIPAFPKWVSERLPDDAFAKAKGKAEALTYGEDPQGFFALVAGQVSGMDLLVRMWTKAKGSDGVSEAQAAQVQAPVPDEVNADEARLAALKAEMADAEDRLAKARAARAGMAAIVAAKNDVVAASAAVAKADPEVSAAAPPPVAPPVVEHAAAPEPKATPAPTTEHASVLPADGQVDGWVKEPTTEKDQADVAAPAARIEPPTVPTAAGVVEAAAALMTGPAHVDAPGATETAVHAPIPPAVTEIHAAAVAMSPHRLGPPENESPFAQQTPHATKTYRTGRQVATGPARFDWKTGQSVPLMKDELVEFAKPLTAEDDAAMEADPAKNVDAMKAKYGTKE